MSQKEIPKKQPQVLLYVSIYQTGDLGTRLTHSRFGQKKMASQYSLQAQKWSWEIQTDLRITRTKSWR